MFQAPAIGLASPTWQTGQRLRQPAHGSQMPQALTGASNVADSTDHSCRASPAVLDRMINAGTRLADTVTAAIAETADRGTVRPEHVTSYGNEVLTLDLQGSEIFESQRRLIAAARREVLIQTFAWDPKSPGGQAILDGLLEASAKLPPGQKLRVRLLVNEGTGLAKKFMQITSRNPRFGRRWPTTQDASIGNSSRDPNFQYAPILRDTDFEVRTFQHSSVGAMHCKTIIVDGDLAGVTGANVQKRNFGRNPAYDIGLTLRGDASRGLHDSFVHHWNRARNPDQATNPMSLLAA